MSKPILRKIKVNGVEKVQYRCFQTSEPDRWEDVECPFVDHRTPEEKLLERVQELESEISRLRITSTPLILKGYCEHQYPTPWMGIMPPTCLKCGMPAPSTLTPWCSTTTAKIDQDIPKTVTSGYIAPTDTESFKMWGGLEPLPKVTGIMQEPFGIAKYPTPEPSKGVPLKGSAKDIEKDHVEQMSEILKALKKGGYGYEEK